MRKTVPALLTAALLVGASPSTALESGSAGYADSRIKTWVYDPAQVYRVVGHFGFVTTIQFAPGERVESVQLGDHISWQVDRLKRGDMLSVVPIERSGGFTNMLVTTNRRIYSFDMTARHTSHIGDADLTFLYRFDYPVTAEELAMERASIRTVADAEAGGGAINRAYWASGPKHLKPTAMFDDGKRTYLAFAAGAPHPAVFAVGPGRKETTVNSSVLADGTLVIHGVKPRFTLRGPDGVVCIYNDALLGNDAIPDSRHASRRTASRFNRFAREDR